MISKGGIKQNLYKMLDCLGRILVLFLFLEIVLLQKLNHFLASRSKLTIELNHRHILDNQIVSTTICILLCLLVTVCGSYSSGINLLARFRVYFELLLQNVAFDL